MKLIFSNGSGVLDKGAGPVHIAALPALPFLCDGVFFDDFSGQYLKYIGGGQSPMTESERAAVASAIAAF